MKIDHINPFIEASCTVLKSVANIDTSLGKVYVKTSPCAGASISIVIGLIGDIKGQVVFSMDKKVGCKIASHMMMGMPVDQLDEISKSAISEAANMILGNAATMLSSKNISVDITPLALFEGKDMQVSTPNMKTICIPINISSDEKIELEIAVIE